MSESQREGRAASPRDQSKARWRSLGLAVVGLLLGGCASHPLPPDWQLNARDALQRSVLAYFDGDTRVEQREFELARREISRTGRADLLARAELLRCAARTASLAFEPCTAFEALRADAAAAERAYADYLDGRADASSIELLPLAQRALARSLALPATDPSTALQGLEPQSVLVGAGVALKAGKASPALIALAVDTASAQGWRRPLLAWLGAQAQHAEQAGQTGLAASARRRMALVAPVSAR